MPTHSPTQAACLPTPPARAGVPLPLGPTSLLLALLMTSILAGGLYLTHLRRTVSGSTLGAPGGRARRRFRYPRRAW